MNEELAQSYISKHILVGLTYLDHNENLIRQEQFHGTVARISEDDGIVVKLHNSEEEFALPPMLESITQAEPGEYRLHSTGEVVVNPDLLSTWRIVSPAPEE